MNKDLTDFLIKAKKAGYASGGESVVTKEADYSKSTRFSDGNFSFHDNYFGGEPFGGREVVFYKGKPYWMMVYYGHDESNQRIIPFLLKCLSLVPFEMPVRGPRVLMEKDMVYINRWKGTLEHFSGEEFICYKDKQVYRTLYQGGLVDQKEG